ncbi:MAG: hypothetical protein J6V90_11800 [Treponema sp.]|nr:hypothetical protein [Treponema sp.]
MKKSFERSIIRRVFALAFFFSAFLAFGSQGLFAQTYVTNNGIIMERVADEDVQQAERLNEEAEIEDKEKRKRLAEISEEEEDVEESDDIDELFGDEAEGDTDQAVSTPTTEIVKVDVKNKPVEFSGELNAELGGYVWFQPWEKTKPLASFNNILKFIGRPRSDFYVYGSFLTQFPQMDFGVYELYFDYTLFGAADISAGKRDISWGLSRMLTTNIIDEKCSVITSEDAANRPKRKTTDSKFTLIATVPFLSYCSIKGLAQYESNSVEDAMADYVSVAGKFEVSFGKFSASVLGKRWAKADANGYDPCIGGEIISTILGQNSNMFVQGLAHFSPSSNALTRAKWTTGIYKYFENPVMLGLSFEYQGIWGLEERSDGSSIGQFKGVQHLFAAEIGWSRFIFTKKWTFGCKWFHDTRNDYGTVFPVIVIEEILPHLDFKTSAPIYYGSQKKYGFVFELVLNLKY